MMSYYPRGHGDGDVEFDEYDTTPYSGGYDIALTYGHALSPSGAICYPPSTSSYRHDDIVDEDRSSYSSSSQPFAYAEDALDNEYRSYSRPPPFYGGPPQYGFGPPPLGPPPPEFQMGGPGYGGGEYGRPSQEYEKPRHGHNKHGGDDSSDDHSDDSDEEKKQRRHGHHHHRHRGYDD